MGAQPQDHAWTQVFCFVSSVWSAPEVSLCSQDSLSNADPFSLNFNMKWYLLPKLIIIGREIEGCGTPQSPVLGVASQLRM